MPGCATQTNRVVRGRGHSRSRRLCPTSVLEQEFGCCDGPRQVGVLAFLIVSPSPRTRPILRAYIDETGDRGYSAKSSPFFAFAALVVADEADADMRATVSEIRRELKVPVGKALHWNEHIRSYPRRQFACGKVAALQEVALNYVAVEKAAIPAASGMRIDHQLFYNYAAGLTMERILLGARHWPGGARDVKVIFGHVRGFDHRQTTSYFTVKQASGSWVPWHLLRGPVLFDGQANWDGLQAADVYAGMLHSAICPDPYGGFEEAHLLRVRHQLRRDDQGRSWGFGFKWLGNEATVKRFPWWPSGGI